jgi:hypothetical protein
VYVSQSIWLTALSAAYATTGRQALRASTPVTATLASLDFRVARPGDAIGWAAQTP